MDKILNEEEFERYLHNQIPITKEMEFWIENFEANDVKIGASLDANINHKGTAFGGSISSLMTICGWAIVFNNIKRIDPDAHIVVHTGAIKYMRPVENDFVAECHLADKDKMEKFIKTYKRYKKARISLQVFIANNNGDILAKFQGEYVAFK